LREPRRKEQHLIMTEVQRSGCPINVSLEVLGDKWSLLIIRDYVWQSPALPRIAEQVGGRHLVKHPSVGERLQAAYEKVMAKKAKGSCQRGATRECPTNVAGQAALRICKKRQLSPS
jgi:hypothetical protein